jgi:hypothetical protein
MVYYREVKKTYFTTYTFSLLFSELFFDCTLIQVMLVKMSLPIDFE